MSWWEDNKPVRNKNFLVPHSLEKPPTRQSKSPPPTWHIGYLIFSKFSDLRAKSPNHTLKMMPCRGGRIHVLFDHRFTVSSTLWTQPVPRQPSRQAPAELTKLFRHTGRAHDTILWSLGWKKNVSKPSFLLGARTCPCSHPLSALRHYQQVKFPVELADFALYPPCRVRNCWRIFHQPACSHVHGGGRRPRWNHHLFDGLISAWIQADGYSKYQIAGILHASTLGASERKQCSCIRFFYIWRSDSSWEMEHFQIDASFPKCASPRTEEVSTRNDSRCGDPQFLMPCFCRYHSQQCCYIYRSVSHNRTWCTALSPSGINCDAALGGVLVYTQELLEAAAAWSPTWSATPLGFRFGDKEKHVHTEAENYEPIFSGPISFLLSYKIMIQVSGKKWSLELHQWYRDARLYSQNDIGQGIMDIQSPVNEMVLIMYRPWHSQWSDSYFWNVQNVPVDPSL